MAGCFLGVCCCFADSKQGVVQGGFWICNLRREDFFVSQFDSVGPEY